MDTYIAAVRAEERVRARLQVAVAALWSLSRRPSVRYALIDTQGSRVCVIWKQNNLLGRYPDSKERPLLAGRELLANCCAPHQRE